MKLSPNSNPVDPVDLLIRLHNQVGAAVDVTGKAFGKASRWLCHGCGEHSHGPSTDILTFTRRGANAHAGGCRASYHRIR